MSEWSGMPEPHAPKVMVQQARVRCGTCGQLFKVPIVPPIQVEVDPAHPPSGPVAASATVAAPQHVVEPGWRCVGSGVAGEVVAEAGSSWPGPGGTPVG